MRPDSHWFSQYFAQDHAGNFVDILIELSKTTKKGQPNEKGKGNDAHGKTQQR